MRALPHSSHYRLPAYNATWEELKLAEPKGPHTFPSFLQWEEIGWKGHGELLLHQEAQDSGQSIQTNPLHRRGSPRQTGWIQKAGGKKLRYNKEPAKVAVYNGNPSTGLTLEPAISHANFSSHHSWLCCPKHCSSHCLVHCPSPPVSVPGGPGHLPPLSLLCPLAADRTWA